MIINDVPLHHSLKRWKSRRLPAQLSGDTHGYAWVYSVVIPEVKWLVSIGKASINDWSFHFHVSFRKCKWIHAVSIHMISGYSRYQGFIDNWLIIHRYPITANIGKDHLQKNRLVNFPPPLNLPQRMDASWATTRFGLHHWRFSTLVAAPDEHHLSEDGRIGSAMLREMASRTFKEQRLRIQEDHGDH